MEKTIEELTLLLMYLTSWEEEAVDYDNNNNLEKIKIKKSWKGYSFDVINELTNKGYLYQTNYKNKSVTLTEEGTSLADSLIKKYLRKV